ncbi:MAG: UDP-N-acetylglucosamine--N-acetylmuramyl-(pentapeptide) pyrophosphoryl-undecaprenol N-acetylglucosamine transferase [Actinobacteria bacterium]|nr:UDP-N-acetylglucosamine--N-acetylmuramyl-(pentapeptide) pyrophosphoryl-undecaprenol N-acetylglucosamine transferase [Actinomycetota bacterium]
MKIVLAGAGTAGHIEPALAVADEWQKEFPKSKFEFVGTTTGLENVLVTGAGYKLSTIPKVTLPRALSPAGLSAPIRFGQALARSLQIVNGADCVIGFGGYVSAPIYFAAAIRRIPFVIHEANAIPGWANKFGAFLGGAMAVGKPVKAGKFRNAEVVGLPLKPAISSALDTAKSDWPAARRSAKAKLGLKSDKPLLLILGGSQGSAAINSIIASSLANLLTDFEVIHSVGGKNQLPLASAGYQPVAYIEDMATAYLAADLIIGRSGAITCAEVNALGKYAIFVPLAIGNGEQARNADFLIEQGRAVLVPQIEFSAQWLIKNMPSVLMKSREFTAGNESDRAAVANIVKLMRRHGRIG